MSKAIEFGYGISGTDNLNGWNWIGGLEPIGFSKGGGIYKSIYPYQRNGSYTTAPDYFNASPNSPDGPIGTQAYIVSTTTLEKNFGANDSNTIYYGIDDYTDDAKVRRVCKQLKNLEGNISDTETAGACFVKAYEAGYWVWCEGGKPPTPNIEIIVNYDWQDPDCFVPGGSTWNDLSGNGHDLTVAGSPANSEFWENNGVSGSTKCMDQNGEYASADLPVGYDGLTYAFVSRRAALTQGTVYLWEGEEGSFSTNNATPNFIVKKGNTLNLVSGSGIAGNSAAYNNQIIITADSGSTDLYHNGLQIATGVTDADFRSRIADNFTLGARQDGSGDWGHFMYNFMIFSGSANSEEIKIIYYHDQWRIHGSGSFNLSL